ncbi:MAG: hypothetical protein ACRD26_11735 [Vicinamibacterales bacterium]
MTDINLSSFIWSVADLLRGAGPDPGTVGRQIVNVIGQHRRARRRSKPVASRLR